MKVHELVAQLQKMPQDLEVYSSYDHWYTNCVDYVHLVPKEKTSIPEHRVNPEPYVDIVLLSDDYKLPDKVNV